MQIMAFCSRCGAKVEHEERFCRCCGAETTNANLIGMFKRASARRMRGERESEPPEDIQFPL
jgi:predicted amidophosphoribosyltransferase